MGWFLAILCWFLRIRIFVPEWGWVGSANAIKIICHVPFSSPSGDGLVLRECMMIAADSAFSSPLGDGVVQDSVDVNVLSKNIFVPEWG